MKPTLKPSGRAYSTSVFAPDSTGMGRFVRSEVRVPFTHNGKTLHVTIATKR